MKMHSLKINSAGGNCYWYNKIGQYHREDGPAIEYVSGDKEWYINGRLHREDGPAIEYANGSKSWYIKGELHREDGPAIERINGYKAWYIKGNELTLDEIATKFNTPS